MRRQQLGAPKYDADGVTLYEADALALLATVSEAQLVVTSPPYNVGMPYDVYDDRRPLDEYLAALSGWIAAMASSLRPGGVLALNLPFSMQVGQSRTGRFKKAKTWRGRNGARGPLRLDLSIAPDGSGWHQFPLAAWAEVAILATGLLPRRSITWVKGTDGNAFATSLAMGNVANIALRPTSERIILASKDTYARTGTSGHIVPSDWLDWAKDVWFIPTKTGTNGTGNTGRIDHPCPFPEELAARLVQMFSEPRDLVVDPFLGSGTTACVVHDLNRRFIGGDLSAAYVAAAGDRLKHGIAGAARVAAGQAVLL